MIAGNADHYCSDIDGPALNWFREEFTTDHRWYAIADLNKFHSFGWPTLPERDGAPQSAFKVYAFRVLMVLKTAERRNDVAERLPPTVGYGPDERVV